MIRRIARYLGASLIATLIISIIATLAALRTVADFGVSVQLSDALVTIGKDLIGFGPLLFVICALAYFVGFLIAFGLSKLLLSRIFWGVIAGVFAVPTAYWLINTSFGMTLLQSTNYVSGWFGIILGSLLGSLFYHKTVNQDNEDQSYV